MRRTVIIALAAIGLPWLLAFEAGEAAAATFTNASLNGRWAVHLQPAVSFAGTIHGNAAGVAAAARQHVVRVGYIDWDGVGVAAGRSIALTDNNLGQSMTIDYTWSGTYTVNPEGTGTLSGASITTATCTPDPPPEGGVCTDYVTPETIAFTIGKRYGDISFAQQPSAGGAKLVLEGQAIRQNLGATPLTFNLGHLRRRWKLALMPAMSFAAIAPGDPAGVGAAGRQDAARVGYVDWTGLGGASGRIVAISEDNSGQTVTVNFAWSGTYVMGIDGVGSMTITPAVTDTDCTPAQAPGVCATFASVQTYSFVMSKSRQRLFVVRSDTTTGATIFLHGELELQ